MPKRPRRRHRRRGFAVRLPSIVDSTSGLAHGAAVRWSSLLILSAACPAAAQAQAPEIIVTGRGLEASPADAVYDVVAIGRDRLQLLPSSRLEDALRDVPGFAQFRAEAVNGPPEPHRALRACKSWAPSRGTQLVRRAVRRYSNVHQPFVHMKRRRAIPVSQQVSSLASHSLFYLSLHHTTLHSRICCQHSFAPCFPSHLLPYHIDSSHADPARMTRLPEPRRTSDAPLPHPPPHIHR